MTRSVICVGCKINTGPVASPENFWVGPHNFRADIFTLTEVIVVVQVHTVCTYPALGYSDNTEKTQVSCTNHQVAEGVAGLAGYEGLAMWG